MLEKKLLPNKNKPFVLLRRSLAFHRSRLLFLQYYNQLLRCKPTRTEYTIRNHIEIHGTGIRVNLWKWLVYQCAVTTSLCVRKHSWLVKIWNKNINKNKKEIIGKNDVGLLYIINIKQYRTRRIKTWSVLQFFFRISYYKPQLWSDSSDWSRQSTWPSHFQSESISNPSLHFQDSESPSKKL